MKLEDQCVSLELARKLKTLGVKQESFFYYADGEIIAKHQGCYLDEYGGYSSYGCGCCSDGDKIKEICSAFTVAELGEMLPFRIFYNEIWHGIEMVKGSREYVITYRFGVSQCPRLVIFDKTEANARAKMLIYLIERGLIEVKGE